MSEDSENKITSTVPRRHDPYAALRFRDYRLYLMGSVIATTGGQMQSAAIGWELYERTGQPIMLGLVGLLQIVPLLCLFLAGGHLADTCERRKVIMSANIVLVWCSLGIAYLSFTKGPIWFIYFCLLVVGIANALSWPSRSSLVPTLLPLEHFSNAMTWSSSGFQAASMIGPAAAGIVLAAAGKAGVVYLISVSATCMFLLILRTIKERPNQRSTEPISLKSLAAGIEYLRNTPIILSAITLDMFAVLFGGAETLLPIYAKDILQVGPVGFGWLRAAPSIGAIAASFIIAHSRPMKRSGFTLLWTVAGFGLCMIVFGFSRNYWLSLTILALSGGLDTISVVVRHTLVQVCTPDELRGRVSAVNNVFIGASNELGSFESGLVAQFFGPVFSAVSGGVGTIISVIGVAFAWPQIRKLGSLKDLTPETIRGPLD